MTSSTSMTRRDARRGDRRAPGRAAAGRIGDIVLWIAAAGGAVCLLLVILAWTFDITLMMFRTGSMAPDIPAGSVAVVQRVPAAEVEVGDVVTVDRDPELPVTHRVTSVSAGAAGEERILTLRGDANEQDDPHPYTVVSVRTVLIAIPGIAPVIAGLGNPFVLGGITIGASILVGWAFWPRGERGERGGDGSDADPGDEGMPT